MRMYTSNNHMSKKCATEWHFWLQIPFIANCLVYWQGHKQTTGGGNGIWSLIFLSHAGTKLQIHLLSTFYGADTMKGIGGKNSCISFLSFLLFDNSYTNKGISVKSVFSGVSLSALEFHIYYSSDFMNWRDAHRKCHCLSCSHMPRITMRFQITDFWCLNAGRFSDHTSMPFLAPKELSSLD